MDQLCIDPYTTVVDPLVHVIEIPFLIRHGELLQALSDVALCPHILRAVILKPLPTLRVMFREVPGPAPIRLCRLTGNGKIFDQVLTRSVLLFAGPQHLCRIL